MTGRASTECCLAFTLGGIAQARSTENYNTLLIIRVNPRFCFLINTL